MRKNPDVSAITIDRRVYDSPPSSTENVRHGPIGVGACSMMYGLPASAAHDTFTISGVIRWMSDLIGVAAGENIAAVLSSAPASTVVDLQMPAIASAISSL